MDLVNLCSKLKKGPVYLKDDYEDIVLRMVIVGDSTHCFIKRRGRKELEFDSQMYGTEISKDEYDKFR